MQPRDRAYLAQMLDAAAEACDLAAEAGRERWEGDRPLQLAVTHLVQIVGEAARRVSVEGQASLPKIPWREVIGMRHKIVHDYFDVDFEVVWQVATQDLPELARALREATEI